MNMIRTLCGFLFLLLLTGMLHSCDTADNPFAGVPGNPVVKRLPGWQPVFLAVNDDLHDLMFINDQVGWIVGENRILLSTASGDVGWSQAPVELPLENLTSVYFINDQMGWIAGNFSGNPQKGQIGYTGNGGGYPVQIEIFENPLNALYFIDQHNGWVGGENGYLARTDNGGYEWEMVGPFTDEIIFDFDFNGSSSGWAVTAAGGVFHTTDGFSWEREAVNTLSDIHAVFMLDEENIWACGSSNTVLHRVAGTTENATWNVIRIDGEFSDMSWNDIFFTDQSSGWIVGNYGTIYHTKNAGQTWARQSSGVLSHLKAIFMVNSQRGWAVGENGAIVSYISE